MTANAPTAQNARTSKGAAAAAAAPPELARIVRLRWSAAARPPAAGPEPAPADGAGGAGIRYIEKCAEKTDVYVVACDRSDDCLCLICGFRLRRVLPLSENADVGAWPVSTPDGLKPLREAPDGPPMLSPAAAMRYLEREDRYEGLRLYDSDTFRLRRYFGQVCRPDYLPARPPAARAILTAEIDKTNAAAIRNYVRWDHRREAAASRGPFHSLSADELAARMKDYHVTDDGRIVRLPVPPARRRHAARAAGAARNSNARLDGAWA